MERRERERRKGGKLRKKRGQKNNPQHKEEAAALQNQRRGRGCSRPGETKGNLGWERGAGRRLKCLFLSVFLLLSCFFPRFSLFCFSRVLVVCFSPREAPAGPGWGVGGQPGLFLSADGLGYGAGRDHIQQVLPLPVRQARRFVAPDASVQVGDVHSWGHGELSC